MGQEIYLAGELRHSPDPTHILQGTEDGVGGLQPKSGASIDQLGELSKPLNL